MTKKQDDLKVTKRDGTYEDIDLDKIHAVLFWATEDLTGVSVSDIEMYSQLQFYDKIKTTTIQDILIRSAADLISEATPNYQYVAARLINFNLRKEVFDQFEPIPLLELVKKNIERDVYDAGVLDKYTDEEWARMDKMLKHDRDFNLTFAAMEQMMGKYLVQDRVNGTKYETPQYLYIMIAATLFSDYPKETRMRYIKDYYNAISTFKLSLPTPIMAGARTKTKQFSSCVKIECDDTLDSIATTGDCILKYVSKKAGIGLGAGRIRAEGSPIRGGETRHTGVIPFYRKFQWDVKSCSQGGVRGGAATLYIPIWHAEIQDVLVLKNNKGTEDNRVRRLDYGIQFNKLMYERLIKGEHITLFSPHDVPDLYDAFFEDQEKFEELYVKYEAKRSIKKTKVSATELFNTFTMERKDTGRMYFMNVDHCNTHSSFDEKVAPVRMSNLCAEITLPTKPLQSVDDENGEIALCTLSAVNLGTINELSDLEPICDLAVRSLDALLSYQDYPIKAAEISTLARRSLGVGVINYAYYLAKNGVKYSDDSALDLTNKTFEAIQYYLIKASVNLAKEVGACEWFDQTKYSKGILPIDTYKSDIDDLVGKELQLDWEWLRQEVLTHGMRNSTLSALMPSETSSQIANATNGIEPPRAYVSIKGSKDNVSKQVVPEYSRLKNKYELLWDQRSPKGYIKLVGVMQKYVDQSISGNTSYNPAFYPGEQVPMSELLGDMLLAYKVGWKTAYYNNTYDGQTDEVDVDDDNDCGDACKI
jgi:ribonucleoside-diphosphate reductase alpha chain